MPNMFSFFPFNIRTVGPDPSRKISFEKQNAKFNEKVYNDII